MNANYLFVHTIHDQRLADTERALLGRPSVAARLILGVTAHVAHHGRRGFVRLLRGTASALAAVASWLDASASDCDPPAQPVR